MSDPRLNERQRAVLDLATLVIGVGRRSCTTALRPFADVSVAQVYAAVRQLERKGLMARSPRGSVYWTATQAGADLSLRLAEMDAHRG